MTYFFSDKTYVRARTMQELRLCFCCFLYKKVNTLSPRCEHQDLLPQCPGSLVDQYWSMAMQQEPIHWWYLPYIRPIFQAYVRGYTSQKMALYGTSILGSWNSLALGCLLCPVFEYFWLWWAEQPVANGTSGVSWKCSSDQNRKRILPKVPRGEWGF
jgi:hypothetical protein